MSEQIIGRTLARGVNKLLGRRLRAGYAGCFALIFGRRGSAALPINWRRLSPRYDICVLIQPAAIRLHHVHRAAGPVVVAGKIKRPVRAAIAQLPRLAGTVRIVGGEPEAGCRFRRIIQHDAVVDGQGWKTKQMHDGGAADWHGADQLPRHAFLMPPGYGQDHPPVAPQNIGLPRSAADAFERPLPSLAEGTQRIVTRHHHAPGFGADAARTARNHLARDPAAGLFIRHRSRGVEPRVVKELPRRARQDKTAVRVRRRRNVAPGNHLLRCGVEPVFPDQLVGKRESVPVKFKLARRRCGRGIHARTSIGFEPAKGNPAGERGAFHFPGISRSSQKANPQYAGGK